MSTQSGATAPSEPAHRNIVAKCAFQRDPALHMLVVDLDPVGAYEKLETLIAEEVRHGKWRNLIPETDNVTRTRSRGHLDYWKESLYELCGYDETPETWVIRACKLKEFADKLSPQWKRAQKWPCDPVVGMWFAQEVLDCIRRAVPLPAAISLWQEFVSTKLIPCDLAEICVAEQFGKMWIGCNDVPLHLIRNLPNTTGPDGNTLHKRIIEILWPKVVWYESQKAMVASVLDPLLRFKQIHPARPSMDEVSDACRVAVARICTFAESLKSFPEIEKDPELHIFKKPILDVDLEGCVIRKVELPFHSGSGSICDEPIEKQEEFLKDWHAMACVKIREWASVHNIKQFPVVVIGKLRAPEPPTETRRESREVSLVLNT